VVGIVSSHSGGSTDQPASRPDHRGGGNGDTWDWTEARRRCLELARRYSANPSEAEDIAQDALLRAWRRRASLRSGDHIWGWLATIVRNEAARHHSRVRPEPVGEAESSERAEDDCISAIPLRVDVTAALSRLESGERLLLRLRYGEDLTQPAIAHLLKLPEGTVKVRLHRARKKLHRLLEGR
jgi:RNA polymerase sigma-70 factor, ECF subfamily